MYDKGRILTGLIVFLVVVLFPIWFSAASGRIGEVPELKLPEKAKECVAPTEYMRQHHMELLNEWRDAVVREGERWYTATVGGKESRIERSLTRTCLGCHESREEFCNKCHNYVSVRPNCFDCHHEKAGQER